MVVGGRPDAHPPFAQGSAVPFDAAFRVQALGDLRGGVGGLLVAHGGQGAGEFGVDLPAVFDAQAGGFPDDQGGPVFADLPGAQGLVGVRHFPEQRFGGADVPTAAGWGVVPGEGDLGVDAAVRAGVSLLPLGQSGSLRVDEGQGERGLGRGAGGFDPFECGDLVDQFGVGGVVVDAVELVDQARQVGGGQHGIRVRGCLRGDQHVFDYIG